MVMTWHGNDDTENHGNRLIVVPTNTAILLGAGATGKAGFWGFLRQRLRTGFNWQQFLRVPLEDDSHIISK